MQNKEKSIGLNAVLSGIKTILSVIFPLITYPYALRVLQVENIGKVNFSSSIVSYFILIAGLGIATYAIREGARVRDNRAELEQFTSEMFSINLLSSIIAIILLIICVAVVPHFHSYALLIAIQSIAIVGNLIGVSWLYSIEEDYAYITIRSLIVHVIALILMFAFVRTESDYALYAGTTVIANAGANIFNFFHAKKYANIRFTTRLNLTKHLKPIMVIFASTVTTTIYVNSDKTILGFLAGDYNVGLYSAAVNVYTVLKQCVGAVILVSLPRLSNYLANNRREDYENMVLHILKMLLTILLPVMTGLFVTSEAVIRVVGGAGYLEATTSMQILSISIAFSMMAAFFTNAVLLPERREKIVLIGTIISALVNIGLNFVLLGKYKQDGAAFTTLLAEIIMCFYQYYYVRKYIKLKLKPKFLAGVLAGCLAIVLVALGTDLVIHGFVLNLILKICLCVIAYATITIIARNEIVLSILGTVKRKVRKKRV